MKKTFIVLFVCCFLFTGCGNTKNQVESTGSSAPENTSSYSKEQTTEISDEAYSFDFVNDVSRDDPVDEISTSAEDFTLIHSHDCPLNIGDYTYSVESPGEYNIFSCEEGDTEIYSIETMADEILTDGETVYYINDDVTWYAIAKHTVNTDEWNNVTYVYDMEKFPKLVTYYNSKLYYLNGYSITAQLCAYDEASDETEVVLDETNFASRHGDMLLYGKEYDAYYSPMFLAVYNLNSGESATICEHVLSYRVLSDKIYYVDFLRYNDDPETGGVTDYICDVYKCNIDGSNKEQLLSETRLLGWINEITESYIEMKQYNSDNDDYTYEEIDYN